jgi:hypothetical protein
MTISWSSNVLHQYVAPGIVEVVAAEIPDLTSQFPEAPYWLANHFLNSIGRGTYAVGTRQLVLGYIRRAFHAFADFHSARQHTHEYLKDNNPHNPWITKYYVAVAGWEAFTLQLSMALDLFKAINLGEGAFKKNDASVEWRLYTMANQIKHLESCVRSGQCSPTDTVPLWLTNTGLASFSLDVSYSDAAEVLTGVGRLAEELCDPVSLRQRLATKVTDPGAEPPV